MASRHKHKTPQEGKKNQARISIIVIGVFVGAFIGFWLAVFFIRYEVSSFIAFPVTTVIAAFVGVLVGSAIRLPKFMRKEIKMPELDKLPTVISDFITLTIKKMRYRKKVRAEVAQELTAHFEDELKDCATDEQRQQKAEQLIEDFGDVKLLAVLLRRAKKRCRPLWRTIIARTFQAVGVLILCFIVYTIWFLTGKPTISVDYLALLNQINRPEVVDEGNAWPHYEKAMALFIEPNKALEKMAAFKNYKEVAYTDFGNLTQSEQKEIKGWVKQNQAAWQELAAGSMKEYCYKKTGYNSKDKEKWLWNILLPHLGTLRDLAKSGIWRSRMEIQQGHISQGFKDCLVLARVGIHWQGKRTTVEQLVGLAISRFAYEEILHIAAKKELSAFELKQFQQELSQMCPQGYPLMNMESQKLLFLDIVQHLFTEGGIGGGHLIPKRWAFLERQARNVHESEFEGYRIARYTAAGIVHARRTQTIAKANELYDQLNEIAKMTPYERYISNINQDDIVSALSEHRYFLIRTFVPGLGRASEIAYRGKSLHKAAITVLALLRYEKEKGEHPENLEEVVTTGYLKELPMDPYSDKTLVYKKMDNNFLLYGVGENFKDDGGTVAVVGGRPRKWGTKEQSDWVFWPVPRSELRQEK